MYILCVLHIEKQKRILRTVFSMTLLFQLQANDAGYVLTQLEDLDMQNLRFQQDGATPHTARETMAILRAAFPGRVISRFGDVLWPPRYPDLTPPQLKKKNIIEEINRKTPDI